MYRRLIILVPALIAMLTACEQQDSLERIRSDGELTVITRNSPTTYYQDKEGADGFEYALAGLFAEELGVRLKVETAFDLDGIFHRLERGEADLAAAGLTLTETRQAHFPHSQASFSLTPQVVYLAGTYRPRNPTLKNVHIELA